MSFSVICDNAPIKPQSLSVIKLPVHAMKQVAERTLHMKPVLLFQTS